MITAFITWASTSLVIKSLITGIFLSLGFFIKDTAIQSFREWKMLIEENLEEGRSGYGWLTDPTSRFFNPRHVQKLEWQKDPTEYRLKGTTNSQASDNLNEVSMLASAT